MLSKIIKYKFKEKNTISRQEIKAVTKVMKSGKLSGFIGGWEPAFFGGRTVRDFEDKCKKYFKVKHAITVNSWTSGLIAAIGATGVEPGDEIITVPWTMCATATAILHWNCIPVFVDIEESTFNIDPAKIENLITKRTKAILAVDIFGHPCNFSKLKKIAKKYNLKIILDSAQSIGSYYKKKKTGTYADIGGFSLNVHKHINTGEGGILVTNNDKYAMKMRLIRNHAETVVSGLKIKNINNMIGYNFRLGEIESAIGIEQLKKLDKILRERQKMANFLINGLKNLEGLKVPEIQDKCTHSFYIFPIVLDVKKIKKSRNIIIKKLKILGVQGLYPGYANVHLLPIYQKKIAYGSNGFPWKAEFSRKNISYKKGICPVAERLHDKELISFEICQFDLNHRDIKLIIESFKRVWKYYGLSTN
jgi:perosamine synthetase